MIPRQILYFAVGPVGAGLLGFISLPVITWLFSKDDVGRIGMFQVALGLSTHLFTLGLDQAYVREYHEYEDTPTLFKEVLLPGACLLVFVAALLLWRGDVLSQWLFDQDSMRLSVLVIVAIIAALLSRFLSLILRMEERGLGYSMAQIMPKVLLLAVLGAYALLGTSKSLLHLLIAYVISVVGVCVVLGWNTRREWLPGLRGQMNVGRLRGMLGYGLPLVVSAVAFWGLTATDKILLRSLSTFDELGLYSVAVSVAAGAVLLQSIFSTVWAPTVYKWASRGENLDRVSEVSRYILLAVVVCFSLAGLFSWLVTYILPSGYDKVQWLVISCLGYPLLYVLSETTVVGIGITRRSSFALIAAVAALLLNVLLNWWLIPIYGARGAAASTCIAFLLFFALRTEFSILVWRHLPRATHYVYVAVLVFGAVMTTLFGAALGVLSYLYWLATLVSVLMVFASECRNIRGYVTEMAHSWF